MRAKKSLGQHFLKSHLVIKKIVTAANLLSSDTVLEIGPGEGILTKTLLQNVQKVVAIEKDDALFEQLKVTFAKEIEQQKLYLVHGDILDFNLTSAGLTFASYKIVANIPYYITGVFLRRFLSCKEYPQSMTLLVQKEVADRIVAKNRKESLLSISIKAYGIPQYITTVGAGNFSPPPKVDSAILSIQQISKNHFKNVPEDLFFEIVRAGFAHKRKQLGANLRTVLKKTTSSEKTLSICGIPQKARAEDIALSDWMCLARNLSVAEKKQRL